MCNPFRGQVDQTVVVRCRVLVNVTVPNIYFELADFFPQNAVLFQKRFVCKDDIFELLVIDALFNDFRVFLCLAFIFSEILAQLLILNLEMLDFRTQLAVSHMQLFVCL
jgi:hypothetical protein